MRVLAGNVRKVIGYVLWAVGCVLIAAGVGLLLIATTWISETVHMASTKTHT